LHNAIPFPGKANLLPNCVIIGAQKSGSTFLHRCLGEHPDVYSPRGEVHFFEDPHYHEEKIDHLENILRKGAGKRVVAIKRPKYLARPECAERIARHCPDAKLLVVLRNPLERAVSAYFHYINYGFIPAVNLENGMRAILSNRYENLYPGAKDIIEFGFYYKHLTRYLKYFDPHRIHVTFFDDLRRNALKEVKRVYTYLDVTDDYVPRSLGSRPQAVIYSLARLRMRRFRNSFVYTYDQTRSSSYRKDPNFLGKIVNKAVLSADLRVMKHLCDNTKPRMSKALKDSLLQIYRSDIEGLENLLHRDLNHWKQ
jgi:Sulfotransferase domain